MILAAPALAAGHKTVFPEAARAAPGGRAVEIVVAQAELSSNINPSMVDVAMGGGLLGVVIDAKIDSDREKHAQGEITPIRMALIDFDADQLAIDTTRTALGKLDWFQAAGPPDFARDPTVMAKSAELTSSAAGQVAFLEYVYDTSADFSSMRVGVTITIADKAAPNGGNPEARLSGRNLVYAQTLTSVVRLSNPGSGAENAARWAANDGALARRALTAAFGEVGTLIPRALTLTEDDLKRMAQGQRKSVGSYGGWVQEDGPDGTLFFNGGLIHVQTIQA
ncbi:MAG: hypothetical protein ACHP84_06775 [Caulobacterales bacterium]